jgi:hypothetical protein
VISGQGKVVTNMDYPASIADEVFEPRPHVLQAVEVHDLDRERETIVSHLKSGIASRDGVTLRLVLLDEGGSLWAIWTGAPVDGQLTHPFRVDGLRSRAGFGLRGLTSNWKTDKRSVASPVTGGRLDGMARPLLDKIGDRVSLDIYKAGKYFTFKDIPVMRIASLYDFEKELGLKRF